MIYIQSLVYSGNTNDHCHDHNLIIGHLYKLFTKFTLLFIYFINTMTTKLSLWCEFL